MVENTATNYLGSHAAYLTPIRPVELVFHGFKYSFARLFTSFVDFFKKTTIFPSYTEKSKMCDFHEKRGQKVEKIESLTCKLVSKTQIWRGIRFSHLKRI